MDLPDTSMYHPPPWLRSGHIQTIYPHLCRRIDGLAFRRERFELPDGDFIDLDWMEAGSPDLAVLCHGLESSSQATYMLGMARILARRGWDVLAMNFRGCSGTPNRLPRFYHSGDTLDLATLVEALVSAGRYKSLSLIGFSLGGNVILKYLGERGENIARIVRRAAAVSVPCDLAGSAARLAEPLNRPYMWRFLRRLRVKITTKAERFPELFDPADMRGVSTFREFDDRYTAPLHGFKDADDYWTRSSCRPYLPAIRIPTLLVNALDDPFLSPSCYPLAEADVNPCLYLETPRWGGHVGFVQRNSDGDYWHERQVANFLETAGPAR